VEIRGSNPLGGTQNHLVWRRTTHDLRLRCCSFVILATVLLACQPTTEGSPGQSSPPIASASPQSAWGPLAVIPPQDGADTGRAEGQLLITDACVYLVFHGQNTLLFWPSDRTRWDEKARAITFLNFDGTLATASSGDAVVLGGGGDSGDESGVSGPDWASRMVWVARPDASCSAEQRWGVGALTR
jgi:hypothetical protein